MARRTTGSSFVVTRPQRSSTCSRQTNASRPLSTIHPPLSAEDLIEILPPVLSVAEDPDLGLPPDAHIIGATDLEPVRLVPPDSDALRGEGPGTGAGLSVTDVSCIHGGLALVRFELPVSALIQFYLPPTSVENRPEALRTYEVTHADPGDTAPVLCLARREMLLAALATYDSEAGVVTGAEPAQLLALARTAMPKNAHLLGLVQGDRVRHQTFGTGVVRRVEGAGQKTEALVEFDTVGMKRLLLAWAPVEPAK